MKEQMFAAVQCVEYLDRFEIREYSKAFKEYVETYSETFVQAVRAAGEASLETVAEELLNALEAGWKAARFWNRSVVKVSYKQMLAFYLSPMLLGLEEPGCARLAQLLRDGWVARWPKDPYEIAEYKTIRKGFHNVVLGVDLDSLRRSHDDED